MTNDVPTDRLAGFDFAAHNAEVAELWDAYYDHRPYRVPIILGINSRFFVLNPDANTEAVDFKSYSTDPDCMFDTQLRSSRWNRLNLLQDSELGLPERWAIRVDFQNYYDAVWFGCTVRYLDGQVPDTRPEFADHPERVMENGLPDPFGGIFSRGLDYFEQFQARAANEEYLGRPIDAFPPGCVCDGIMTIACNLFGPEFVCTAMAAEPERLHVLFDFITEAIIARMRAWREKMDLSNYRDPFGIGDDSIALISTRMYQEHVLPYHRRLYDFFAPGEPHAIHLCGDATHHFPILEQELNVKSFDTGFPVDFATLRENLGDDVTIYGGPRTEFLKDATPAETTAETRRILGSGILDTGRFVLREANNMAPGTPIENIEAMYYAGRRYGVLTKTGERC